MEHENKGVNEEFKKQETDGESFVGQEALDENEQEGSRLISRINIAAIVIALIILAGAIGFRAGMFDSSPASASSDQGQQLNQGPQGPSSGGCSSGGCASAAGTTGATAASKGGCGPGGGCGSNNGPVDIKKLKVQVSEAYGEYSGQSGFDVEIQDFGCHQEAAITRGGKVLNRISISGNRMSLIE